MKQEHTNNSIDLDNQHKAKVSLLETQLSELISQNNNDASQTK